MTWLVLLLLILGIVIAWTITLVGLPGNWLMLLLVTAYAAWGPADGRLDIGWQIPVALLVLALVGEALEFVASAATTTQAGGSGRSAVLAIVGSVVGAIAGGIIGIPIPIVGPLIAALLFAALGALTGAMLGERSGGRDWTHSLQVGRAAFHGRLLGTLAKLLAGTLMALTTFLGLAL